MELNNGNVLPIKAFVPPILIMGFLMGLKGIQDKNIVCIIVYCFLQLMSVGLA